MLTSHSGQYGGSCQDCLLDDGDELTCQCKNDGGTYVGTIYNLSKSETFYYLCKLTDLGVDDCIENNNGNLQCT